MRKRLIALFSVIFITMLTVIGCSLSSKDTIVMGTFVPYPPFEYYEGKELVGIDIDIAKELGHRLNKKVDVQLIEFEKLPDALAMNKVDIVGAALTITDERKQYMDFTSSYMLNSQSVLVTTATDLNSLNDLKEKGTIIGVESGTTCRDVAFSVFESNFIKEYASVEAMLNALDTNTISAMVLDTSTALWLTKTKPNLKVLETFEGSEEYAFGVAKNGKYSYEIKETFDIMLKDGSIEQIIDNYLGQE